MIRILSLLFILSLPAFSEELGLKNVTPEDQIIINQNLNTLYEVKSKLTEEQFQALYDSGNMIRLLRTQPHSIQRNESSFDRIVNSELMRTIENNPYTGQDPKVIIEMIEERSRGTQMEAIFQRIPRAKIFMAHWMTHENAMPKFFRVIKKKKQLINVGIFSVIIFLVMLYLIEKWTAREPYMFVRIFKRWIGRVASFWMCLGLFYFVFKKDIGPTWQLVKQYIFSTEI